jgi:hypothetical protein
MEKIEMNKTENPEQKPIFYVFSGIEKTLVSRNFLNRYYNGLSDIYGVVKADPDCIEALDFLLDSLDEKFDARLVITSKMRREESNCVNYLKLLNNLKHNKPILFTKFVDGPRGEKIVDFLDSQNASPLEFHKAPFYIKFLKNLKDNPDFKNYVVIDGKRNYLSKYIPSSQMKIVSHKKGFTIEDAAEILKQHQITIKEKTTH